MLRGSDIERDLPVGGAVVRYTLGQDASKDGNHRQEALQLGVVGPAAQACGLELLTDFPVGITARPASGPTWPSATWRACADPAGVQR
jgi:hypothetical protein